MSFATLTISSTNLFRLLLSASIFGVMSLHDLFYWSSGIISKCRYHNPVATVSPQGKKSCDIMLLALGRGDEFDVVRVAKAEYFRPVPKSQETVSGKSESMCYRRCLSYIISVSSPV